MAVYRVFAPLSNFSWKGEDFTGFPDLLVRRLRRRPELRGLDETLALDERNALLCPHWLCFDWTEGELHSAEVVNLFLLSLWLAKPTMTHVAVRFEVVVDPESSANGSRWRMLDRFTWVPDHVEEEVDESDLQAAANFFYVLRQIRLGKGRLLPALLLSMAGCETTYWQVALITYSAAAEAILSYSTGNGVAHRLAATFACLVATDRTMRDLAFQEFERLYGIRSDLMHGRMHRLADLDNQKARADFGMMLRRLWRVVLSDQKLIPVLEGNDKHKREYFKQLQEGYQRQRVGKGSALIS